MALLGMREEEPRPVEAVPAQEGCEAARGQAQAPGGYGMRLQRTWDTAVIVFVMVGIFCAMSNAKRDAKRAAEAQERIKQCECGAFE